MLPLIHVEVAEGLVGLVATCGRAFVDGFVDVSGDGLVAVGELEVFAGGVGPGEVGPGGGGEKEKSEQQKGRFHVLSGCRSDGRLVGLGRGFVTFLRLGDAGVGHFLL